jgi:hypothetical protein
MSFGYSFYFQRYGENDTALDKTRIDLEDRFGCTYQSMTNIDVRGAVKNIYTESYAESNGVRAYIDPDTKHETLECVLTLLFRTEQCRTGLQSLLDFLYGYFVEFSDTFRNRYVTLYLQKAVTLPSENLHAGKGNWQQVQLTFTNVYGRSYTVSQIGSQTPSTERIKLATGGYLLLE